MAWYVEYMDSVQRHAAESGFTVMKFSGYRPCSSQDAGIPVVALVLARVSANWPTLPFANKDLKSVLLRSDADPVTGLH